MLPSNCTLVWYFISVQIPKIQSLSRAQANPEWARASSVPIQFPQRLYSPRELDNRYTAACVAWRLTQPMKEAGRSHLSLFPVSPSPFKPLSPFPSASKSSQFLSKALTGFFGLHLQHTNFPGQGLNMCHCSDLSHNSGNTRSLT